MVVEWQSCIGLPTSEKHTALRKLSLNHHWHPLPSQRVPQRGVSGIRRYVSWRRRPTKARLEPSAEVDHKKSTEEEKDKKVG